MRLPTPSQSEDRLRQREGDDTAHPGVAGIGLICGLLAGRAALGLVRVGDSLSILAHLPGEKSGSFDGLRPSLALVDELHAIPAEDTWAALQGGMQTRTQPMIIGLTTAGMLMEGPAYERYLDGARVLRGEVEDQRYFPLIFAPDVKDVKGDGWLDPVTWGKACPSMGTAVQPAFYEAKAAEAKRRSARPSCSSWLSILNYWLGTGESWLDPDEVESCARHPDDYPEMTWGGLSSFPCHVGIDLATTLDLTAVAYRFSLGGEGDGARIAVKHRYWAPEARADDNEHYRQWAEDGWLTLCPGTEIDLPSVYAQVKADIERLDVRGVGYDPHQGRLFAQTMIKDFPDLAGEQGHCAVPPNGAMAVICVGAIGGCD